ncbi:hypothetical protein UFOVP1672_61 [uncultured Caudovirales phage]|uniref:Uncharacterized protein n=1 Tax=uncultured Caudovirales phage TaxID=2100421 RepID=A0A6J5Q5U2_9CAUD|nr:hypothetical protein UFOVP988_83 [uncultured Caudovirales phage]CAB4211099.1 hypothetical protein UFOVP1425_83 [uncultured Caudovirales phage]CAB4223461.1 hypothetical protein UFOVP1672_61 [uncultured Caudovirales phage]
MEATSKYLNQPLRSFDQAIVEVLTARVKAGAPLPTGFVKGPYGVFQEVPCWDCGGEGEVEVQISETRFRWETCNECNGDKVLHLEIELGDDE